MERAGIQDKGMADVTDRRENNVKQGMEELPDRNHLKAEFGVHYQHMEIRKAWFAINNGSHAAEPVR